MKTYCIYLGQITTSFFLINFCFVFQCCHSWENDLTKDRPNARSSGHDSAGPDHGLPPPAWSTDESHVCLTRVSHHCPRESSCCTHPTAHWQRSSGVGSLFIDPDVPRSSRSTPWSTSQEVLRSAVLTPSHIPPTVLAWNGRNGSDCRHPIYHSRRLLRSTAGASTSPACRQGQWRISFYAEEIQTLAYLEEGPAASLKGRVSARTGWWHQGIDGGVWVTFVPRGRHQACHPAGAVGTGLWVQQAARSNAQECEYLVLCVAAATTPASSIYTSTSICSRTSADNPVSTRTWWLQLGQLLFQPQLSLLQLQLSLLLLQPSHPLHLPSQPLQRPDPLLHQSQLSLLLRMLSLLRGAWGGVKGKRGGPGSRDPYGSTPPSSMCQRGIRSL